jgi:hypothetical protein
MGLILSLFEIHANGSNSNSGMFDPSATVTTTLTTSNGTSATPTVTASNYTFVSSDIGDYLYIKSGTNWNPGWYRITAVNAGAATVDASIGNVFQPSHRISAIQGVSTTASASSGSWTIDYTQIATASRTYTDLVITPNANIIQSTANPFTVNMIGNSINISGGTNFTTGVYLITSLSGSSAVLDRVVGTVSASGGTGSVGGALQNWTGFCSLTAADAFNTQLYVYVKGSSGTFNWSGVPITAQTAPTIIGYSNVRGDFGKPTIRLSANSTAFNTRTTKYISNFIIDGQSNTGTVGVTNNLFQVTNYVVNCDFKNISIACSFNSGVEIYQCSFENCANTAQGYTRGVRNCVIKNCAGVFNYCESGSGNIFINHTGNCFYLQNTGKIMNNTFYNVTGNAIRLFYSHQIQTVRSLIENNVFSNISGYAIDSFGGGSTLMNIINNNAYFSVTSGFTNNSLLLNTGDNSPFTNRNNIALSASPFISAANLDLRLNNDINGGKLCQGAGQIQTYPLTATISSIDIGAVQSSSNSVDRNIAPVSKSLTIKSDTTSYTEFINLIGIGYTTSNLKAYYTRVGSAPVEITLTSQTVNGAWTTGGFVEIDTNSMPGIYRFDIPNAVFASGSSSAILQISNISTGDKAIIIYKFQDQQTIDFTQTFPNSNNPQTVGDALNAARSSGFGKWVLNDKTLTLYGADNTTVVKTFTLNSSTFPTERS